MTTSYSPEADGQPDPGEVVWAWVAFEDDPSQGKDRPVLVIGRDGVELLCLQLTSKDHDRDAEEEARYGRYWMDVGSGDWDHDHRDSEVRLDRLLRLAEADVRREGAALGRAVFDAVVTATQEHHTLPG
jgi:PemK-like, MazF-like toxin of type II toxin-antitoxin system